MRDLITIKWLTKNNYIDLKTLISIAGNNRHFVAILIIII